ncbi:hypothetical protein CONPUDRAFT_134221 [Coniophora puteana RWD-64-598 SS2]|uniref:Zn(2)-C6 fungal-type domain-containing protein n=1 Tax=Coniophora puteana (strain RWD-64-598) TaxID=741705 RepID=A0A5M3N6I5_CONPW|nr:uncharacterized protein CONPUDRAFT_134221 [Coniophora puteana RWD-64-598 SS2]EIW86878.1 hypothetical protein CONPUDRAFT_134221 [Coniophora puteana RWD-64-598 SS2]
MDSASSHPHQIKQQDDQSLSDLKGDDKRSSKTPAKTLNRVPRACNACRKQKMRCEGADNPPCRRCRHAGLDCLFEKPSREATLTGEAGLERIRSLEAHVADIRQTQTSIQSTLLEIVSHLRGGSVQHARSPSTFSPTQFPGQSPSIQSTESPLTSAGPNGSSGSHAGDGSFHGPNQPNVQTPTSFQGTSGNIQSVTSSRPAPRNAMTSTQSQGVNPEFHPPQLPPSYDNASTPTQTYGFNTHASAQSLPSFSSIQGAGGAVQQAHTSSRYSSMETSHHRSAHRHAHAATTTSGNKRAIPSSSNVTSADSSDVDDDDNGELPASGLVAPWEVLRGLADVAIERAAKENGEMSSEPQSRTRTPSPERQGRPPKRRKIRHRVPRGAVFPDVVTKNIIPEFEARELFRIFYQGCSTFLPVFDSNVDTFDGLHERSPFAVDAICMVASRVRDGGGPASDVYQRCLEAVQAISCATLFSPVSRIEAVQAMVLVSGWSDNGWLSGGHAVRMAMELSMHKAWPKLLRRMQNKSRTSDGSEDRDLVIASRTWFCLYLFEHQLSYGTGRPAILKDDESIWQCRLLLQHPLAIEDDMRLVSTVELMAIRERTTNNLAPSDRPVDEAMLEVLRQGDTEFSNWYKTWDHAFSQKYEDAAFYRQSLQIQQLHAQLFHNASALRGVNGPDDAQRMPASQRDLAMRSIQIARQGLDITVNSPSYREGMKYAVHYTHVTATFMASFMLRLARLFPDDCNMHEVMGQVDRLTGLMSQIPGKRYAITLQLMMKRAKKRRAASNSRSPHMSREAYRQSSMHVDQSGMNNVRSAEAFSPTYNASFTSSPETMRQAQAGTVPPHGTDVDSIWRGFEMTANEQLPVWISDQSLGGSSFPQQGMDAFLLPNDYLPHSTQIW